MRSEIMEIEAGYYQDSFDPGGAERFVLRFPSGEILVSSIPGERLRLEVDIQGSSAELSFWKPSIRRREGLLVIADEEVSSVMVSRVRLGLPASFRDLEIHTASGAIDVRGVLIDVLATADTGDIHIDGANDVELSSVSGHISLERSGSAIIRSINGEIRCEDVQGAIVIDNQSGSVSVEHALGNVVIVAESADVEVCDPRGRLRIVTKSGDVNLELSSPFSGGEVITGEGDVAVTISSSEIELRCETLSGTINAPGCSVSSTSGPRRCALHLGRGGKRIHIKSVSGDVDIIR